jgi:hypothetical protein
MLFPVPDPTDFAIGSYDEIEHANGGEVGAHLEHVAFRNVRIVRIQLPEQRSGVRAEESFVVCGRQQQHEVVASLSRDTRELRILCDFGFE